MKFTPVTLISRSGTPVLLRSAVPEDAQQMIDHLKNCCGESPFLLSEPEEIRYTPEGEADFLRTYENDPNCLMLNAYAGDSLAGNGSFSPVGTAGRISHRCSVGIAVRKEWQGQGIGELLMRQLIGKARECGFEIMELDVVSTNEKAIRLYEKLGFRFQGRIAKGIKYKDGTYADLELMALDL